MLSVQNYSKKATFKNFCRQKSQLCVICPVPGIVFAYSPGSETSNGDTTAR